MAEQVFTVSGIHCHGCAANVEKGLRRLDGVRRVAADPATQHVRVRFDEQRLEASALSAQLERLGFSVAEDGR